MLADSYDTTGKNEFLIFYLLDHWHLLKKQSFQNQIL